MQTNAQRTHSEFGQSIWYDNVQRGSLKSGQFRQLVAAGVRGCTSNPTIFQQAISRSSDYDSAMAALAQRGSTTDAIYHELVVEDIRAAADDLRDVYESSNYRDGYVSLEVRPQYAHDAGKTVAEALELHARVDRPNLMIKVPATNAGLQALSELTARGVSVNVTLIFSRTRYVEVAQAYIDGLQKAKGNGLDLSKIASVASFFISRIDSNVDQWLKEHGHEELQGKAAIANAKLAYREFERLFTSDTFKALAENGAQVQRLLWASTSTKDPKYADTLYLDELVGRDTVNTVPPATLAAFQDHGRPTAALHAGLEEAKAQLEQLASLGLDLEAICNELLDAGIVSFTNSMVDLYATIDKQRAAFERAQPSA